MDYRLYLFDFDYTLVNSEPAIVKCFHITLQKLGYPDVPDERIKKTIGLPMVEAVKRIVGTADDAEAERFVDAYRPEADRYMTPGRPSSQAPSRPCAPSRPRAQKSASSPTRRTAASRRNSTSTMRPSSST